MLVMSTCAAGSGSATVAGVDTTSAAVTTVKTGVLPGLYHRASFFLFNDATASYYTYGQTATALDKPLQLPIVAGKSIVYSVGRQLRAFDASAYQPQPRDLALLTDAPRCSWSRRPTARSWRSGQHAGDAHDLSLLTTATGATRALRADYTAFAGFTDDSVYALFIDNVDSRHSGAVVAAPVAGGAPSRWLSGIVANVQPARASKLVYTEVAADGVASLKVVNLARDSAPVTLAKGVDATAFATDPDRSRVLYSRSKTPDQGLFYSAIP